MAIFAEVDWTRWSNECIIDELMQI